MCEELLKKNKDFIKLLCETKSGEQRKALLDTITPSQIRTISELCLNLLHGRCGEVDEPLREKLVKNQEFVRKLATEERPFARKRNLLSTTHQREDSNQTGKGIFSFLLPVLGGVLNSIVGGITK